MISHTTASQIDRIGTPGTESVRTRELDLLHGDYQPPGGGSSEPDKVPS